MKRKKRRLQLMAWLFTATLVGSGMFSPVGASAAKKPKLNKKKVTIQVGKTVQLKVKNKKKSVKWSTSNAKIATVSKKGKVKGKKKGTAKITAKTGGKKLTCKVIVKAAKKKVSSDNPEPSVPAVPSQTQNPAPVQTSSFVQTGKPSDGSNPGASDHSAATPAKDVTKAPPVSDTLEPSATVSSTELGQTTEDPKNTGGVVNTPGNTGDPEKTPETGGQTTSSPETETPEPTPTEEVKSTPKTEIAVETPTLPPTLPPVLTPTPVPTYPVTIQVTKDGTTYSGHGKVFQLKKSGTDEFMDGFSVENGSYEIYENYVNTGVGVTVQNAAATVTIEYFTVSFMDGNNVMNTPKQTVLLKGSKVAVPTGNDSKQGYSLEKWVTTDNGDTEFDFNQAITARTNIYAKWKEDSTVASYTIQYYKQNLDGTYTEETESNIEGNINQAVKSPKEIDGFCFVRAENNENPPKQDGSTIVKYYYDRNTYTLTWDAGEGKFNDTSLATQKVQKKYGESITAPTGITREGYTFNGKWNPAPAAVMPAGDVTYTAKYDRNTYTISYNLKANNEVSDFAYEYWPEGTVLQNTYTVEDTVTLPKPSKIGYTFAGWTGSNGSTPQMNVTISAGSTGNKSYTPNWTPNTDTIYYVEHYQESADGSTSVLAEKQELKGTTGAQIAPEVKSYEHFTAPAKQTVTISVNTTTVKYYYARKTYQLTWDANGGKIKDTLGNYTTGSTRYEAVVTAPVNLFRAGYTFAGWDTTPASKMPGQDTTYTAKWSANTDTPYTVKYHLQNANDNNYTTETKTYTGTTDTQVTAPVNTYTGFKSPLSQQITISGEGTSSVDYYYDRETYTLTWDANGGAISDSNYTKDGTVRYGATVKAPASLVKVGYSFQTWEPAVAESMPARDVTYTAKYTVQTYTVSYELAGGSWKQGTTAKGTYTIEDEAFTLPTPERSGYTFEGWTGSNGTSAQKTVTITKGSVGDKSYTANWKANVVVTPTKAPTPTPTKAPTPTPTKAPTPTPTKAPTVAPSGYKVILTVKLDGVVWSNSAHNKTFALYNGSTYVADLEAVANASNYQATVASGTYQIYEGKKNTNVTVTVESQDVSQTINYWTVKFYDSSDKSTVIGTQIVLHGESPTEPEMVKPGYTADYWRTSSGGLYYFDDENPVTGSTSLYADFTKDEYYLIFDFDGGGWDESETLPDPVADEVFQYDTETFTLPHPVKPGYTFVGWTGYNGTAPELDITITKGSTGNIDYERNYTANWMSNIQCTAAPITPTKDILSIQKSASSTQKVALTMPINQMVTDEWLGNAVREGVTPQGYTSYIYYDENYSNYFVVYLSNNRVVGMATMSKNFSYQYTDSKTVSYGEDVPSGFNSLSKYDYSGGYYYDAGDAYVMVYKDMVQASTNYGKVYAIQVFAKSVTVADEQSGSETTKAVTLDELIKVESMSAGYADESVCKSMANELMDWANAYRATAAGKAKFDTWVKNITSQNTAQWACERLSGGSDKTSTSGSDSEQGSGGLLDSYQEIYGTTATWMMQTDGSRSPDAFGFMTWWLDSNSNINANLYNALTKTPDIDEYYACAGYTYKEGNTYAVLHFVHP